MKRLGLGNGAIYCLCALTLARCGGRTETEWETGGTGGVPATGTGGNGSGGKVKPASGGAISTGGVLASGGTVTICPAGTVSCGSKCVDLQSDPNHCGSCSLACGDSGCVNGACVGRCPTRLLACGNQCVDPQTDPNYCGASGSCSGAQRGQDCAADGQCRAGRCESTSRSCLALLNSGSSIGDTFYKINPGPDPTVYRTEFCNMTLEGGGWTRCALVTNNPAEDLDNNTWFDQCVDWTMAKWSRGELLITLHDSRNTLVYSATAKRTGAWTYNTLTSLAGPDEQALFSLHDPLPLSTSDRLWITGRSASNKGCSGSQGNGYGILVAPAGSATSEGLLRLMVMPYRLQVGSHEPRQFGMDNLQWSPSNEISFDATPFSTCGAPTRFLGWFEFYVR